MILKMITDTDEFFYPPVQKTNWYLNTILTFPAISFSLWCIANTTYTILIYEHIHNILKNVTIHIET